MYFCFRAALAAFVAVYVYPFLGLCCCICIVSWVIPMFNKRFFPLSFSLVCLIPVRGGELYDTSLESQEHRTRATSG